MSRQLVALSMLVASLVGLWTVPIVGIWFTALLYIVVFTIGCSLMFRKEAKHSTLRFLKELKRLARNFDDITKDDRTTSLSNIALSVQDLVGIQVVQEHIKPKEYDKEAQALADCIGRCERMNNHRKDFLKNIIEYFEKYPKNLEPNVLAKMVDEFREMVIQHYELANRLVDIVDRIGYVKKNMKENFSRLKIDQNQLAGALKSLIQQINEELLIKLSEYVPAIAKEFTVEAIS